MRLRRTTLATERAERILAAILDRSLHSSALSHAAPLIDLEVPGG
jgi:hypothetical protein